MQPVGKQKGNGCDAGKTGLKAEQDSHRLSWGDFS